MQPLTKEWYDNLEIQAAQTFVNLPLDFQLRGYDYNFISKSYLKFFSSETNDRSDKLLLAKKFLKFIRQINKNRAKQELGVEFFETLEYFYSYFPELLSKQDIIHLQALDLITEAIDKTQFVEDIISYEELKVRASNLTEVKQKEEVIEADWSEFEEQYKLIN